jgi:hypothetical protein
MLPSKCEKMYVRGWIQCSDHDCLAETQARFLQHYFDEKNDGTIPHQIWRDIKLYTRWSPSVTDAASQSPTSRGVVEPQTERVPKAVALLAKTDERSIQPILKALRDRPSEWDLDDPLWFYAIIINQVAEQHHNTVLRVRDMIHGKADHNNLAPKAKDLESTTYERLYQIAWHASTAVEILEADLRSLEDVIELHGQMLDTKSDASAVADSSSHTDAGSNMLKALERANPRFPNPVHQQLMFASETMHNMRLRCKTYKERAHNDSKYQCTVCDVERV